jgi:hypothetical protein
MQEKEKIEKKEGFPMKKSAVLMMTSMILLMGISNVYAAEILGYPLVEKQAKFYGIILGVIASSAALVAVSYLFFWLVDSRKNAVEPLLRKEERSFAGELAAAGQSAE